MVEKATHVTTFWNLARNPGKNSSKIRRKKAKFEFFAIELMKFINSIAKKVWRFLTKKLRLENGAKRCKGVHCVDLGESFPTSIYYLIAKIGVDTAENEPLEVWGKIFNIIHWCP